eukprot:SM000299S10843  [mRNA]  locus=s299:67633:68163:+ [translate_table: standard]
MVSYEVLVSLESIGKGEIGTPPRPRGGGHRTACALVDGVGKGALKRYGQAHAEDLCERTGGVEAGHRPWQTRPPVNGLAGKPLNEIQPAAAEEKGSPIEDRGWKSY